MIYFPFGIILNILFANYLLETTSVPEIEMFEFSTLEWLILLLIIIVIVWILIVLQVRSSGAHQFKLEARADDYVLAGDNHGKKGIENT